MAWLSQNWIWLVLGAAFVGLHLFGHGAHGSHRQRRAPARDGDAVAPPPRNHPPH